MWHRPINIASTFSFRRDVSVGIVPHHFTRSSPLEPSTVMPPTGKGPSEKAAKGSQPAVVSEDGITASQRLRRDWRCMSLMISDLLLRVPEGKMLLPLAPSAADATPGDAGSATQEGPRLRELRRLESLANLLVRSHEVVAVAAWVTGNHGKASVQALAAVKRTSGVRVDQTREDAVGGDVEVAGREGTEETVQAAKSETKATVRDVQEGADEVSEVSQRANDPLSPTRSGFRYADNASSPPHQRKKPQPATDLPADLIESGATLLEVWKAALDPGMCVRQAHA